MSNVSHFHSIQVSARFCEGGNHKCMPPKGIKGLIMFVVKVTNEIYRQQNAALKVVATYIRLQVLPARLSRQIMS